MRRRPDCGFDWRAVANFLIECEREPTGYFVRHEGCGVHWLLPLAEADGWAPSADVALVDVIRAAKRAHVPLHMSDVLADRAAELGEPVEPPLVVDYGLEAR